MVGYLSGVGVPNGTGPLLVLSPHLDDAVLGCGQRLAREAERRRVTVVTVFAGVPDPHPVTDWDEACGFEPGDRPVIDRRGEDAAALAVLGVEPVWLDLLEDQYRSPHERELLEHEIATAVWETIAARRPEEVLVPLGVFHRDHVALHEACASDLAASSLVACGVYEDALYRVRAPDEAGERLEALRRCVEEHGRELREETLWEPPLLRRKLEALAAYASQLRALSSGPLPAIGDAWAPERLWWS